jgi:hypothetical protein
VEYSTSTTTPASIERAWSALIDVLDYPQWTQSITAVTPLDTAGLAVGSRFRVKQPGMPARVWQVSEVVPHRSYVWETSSPGVRTLGQHWLDQASDGGTRITMRVEQTGALASLVWALTGARTRRFLGLEAAGIRAAAER